MTTTSGEGRLAALRLARRHCPPTCFGYHASWPLVRSAGIKASPRWHTEFYRAHLTATGLIGHPRRVRALVAGAADHTLPAILSELIGTDRLDLTLIDQCPTAIEMTRRWAYNHPALNLHTEIVPIQDLPPPETGYDLAVTDGLLSLLPDTETRRTVLRWFAWAIHADGLVLYTTRLTPPGCSSLEYDRIGRLVQTAATLTWPHRQPTRWQAAAERWNRPSRDAAYTTTAQLEDEFKDHFTHVHLSTDPTPPTAPLRLHPRRLRGATSTIVRAVASQPKNETL